MTVYLDTSSLVKLYVEEVGSAAVVELVGEAAVVTTSVVAYAEMRAALARRRRERTLGATAGTNAAKRLDADWQRFIAIDVTTALARRAGQLADRFDLRGFGAIHLASFELVVERAGEEDDVHFSSADAVLAKAAKRIG